VAAEYWGISLDLVMRRITDGLVPHMTEAGFVFVDVDPWATACTGGFRHEPPPTFVGTAETPPPVESYSAVLAHEDMSLGELDCCQLSLEDSEQADEAQLDEDLPELDEEESATFGRLSWEEVRHQVSRTRRPPPSFRN
jgi:hypothetical protein